MANTNFTAEQLKAFYDCYINAEWPKELLNGEVTRMEDPRNPHSNFANQLGMNRQEAKVLAYTIGYTYHKSQFMNLYDKVDE